MLKIFTITFAVLSVILAGCSSKSPEPQVVEEKLDLEHVKKIEEQIKKKNKNIKIRSSQIKENLVFFINYTLQKK